MRTRATSTLKPASRLVENVTVRVRVANRLAVTALALALAGYIYLAVPLALVAVLAPRLGPFL